MSDDDPVVAASFAGDDSFAFGGRDAVDEPPPDDESLDAFVDVVELSDRAESGDDSVLVASREPSERFDELPRLSFL